MQIDNKLFEKLANKDGNGKPFDKDFWINNIGGGAALAIPVGIYASHKDNKINNEAVLGEEIYDHREFVPYTEAGITAGDTPITKAKKIFNLDLRFGKPNPTTYDMVDHPPVEGSGFGGVLEFSPTREFVLTQAGKVPIGEQVKDALKYSPKHIGLTLGELAVTSALSEAMVNAPALLQAVKSKLSSVHTELNKRAALYDIIERSGSNE